MTFSSPPHKLRYVGGWTQQVRRPFNFVYSMWKPSHFFTGLEIHSREATWRTFREAGSIFGVRFSMSRPETIRLDVWAKGQVDREIVHRLLTRIAGSYGFDEDLREFVRLVRKNRHETHFKPLLYARISCPESLFEIAVLSVLLQNTTIARTAQMFKNLLLAAGSVVDFDGVQLRVFFDPTGLAGIGELALRSVCRVGYRAPTLQALGLYFDRTSDPMASASSLVDRLLEIRGIGPYSAGVIANAALRDPRAMGLDVWNTQLAARLLGLEPSIASKDEVRARLSNKYPSFEGLALLYITEAAYINCPVDPLAVSAADARRRSRQQLAGVALGTRSRHVPTLYGSTKGGIQAC